MSDSADDVVSAMAKQKMSKVALAKDKARLEFLEVTAPIRSKVLSTLKSSIKAGVLADPDMWLCVKNACEVVLDQFLSDVEDEIERNIQTAVLQQEQDYQALGPSGGLLCLWYRFRAFMLHHYLPHDKYLFGKFKDPVYVVLYILTLVPIHGVRICIFAMILLMLVFPEPDEYQLINFILLCKGTQFFTSGLIQLAVGAGKYFHCYSFHKDALLECIDTIGPGAADGFGLALDYLGSIALVWVSFWLLGRSKKHAMDKHSRSSREDKEKEQEAGGRLKSLLYYDRKCFVASLLLLFTLTAFTCWQHVAEGWGGLRSLARDPQFSSNIFWCCVIYSILSLPFAPFMISGLQEVMTHCFATGYNMHGACVTFGRPPEETATFVRSASFGFTKVASHATGILRTLQRGRAMRGANSEEFEYKFGDFTRGLWAQATGKTAKKPGEDAVAGGERPDSGESSAALGPDWWKSGEEVVRSVGRRLGTGDKEKGGPPMRASTVAAFESAAAYPLGSVILPPERMEARNGVTYFCLEVVPDGSLDAESAQEVWEVMRRFSDFQKLRSCLGSDCDGYADAPFPSKTWLTACTGAQLEQRRRELEVWLNRVLVDASTETQWNKLLQEFLQEEEYCKAVKEPEGISSSSFENIFEHGGRLLAGATALEDDRAGAGSDYHYKFGDLTRGFLSKVMGSKGATSSGATSSGVTSSGAAKRSESEIFAGLPFERTEEGPTVAFPPPLEEVTPASQRSSQASGVEELCGAAAESGACAERPPSGTFTVETPTGTLAPL